MELTSARRSVSAEFARRLTPPFYAYSVTVVKQTPSCEAPLHSATSLLPHLLFAPKRKTTAAEMPKQLVQIPVLFGEGQANLRGRSQGGFGKGPRLFWVRSRCYLGKVRFCEGDLHRSIWHQGCWEADSVGKVQPLFLDLPHTPPTPSPNNLTPSPNIHDTFLRYHGDLTQHL